MAAACIVWPLIHAQSVAQGEQSADIAVAVAVEFGQAEIALHTYRELAAELVGNADRESRIEAVCPFFVKVFLA